MSKDVSGTELRVDVGESWSKSPRAGSKSLRRCPTVKGQSLCRGKFVSMVKCRDLVASLAARCGETRETSQTINDPTKDRVTGKDHKC
jgi:hypothetical protein